MYNFIKLDAGHDRNGNPRRVFLVLSGDGGNNIIDAIDEGYNGDSEVRKKYPSIIGGAVTVVTTPKEYKYLLKNFSKK